MIFSDLMLKEDEPIYIQIKNHIKDMIKKGFIAEGSKLPSTRELSSLLNVSRNSVINAYEELEYEGTIYSVKGKGTFVGELQRSISDQWSISWDDKANEYSKLAEELDIVKSEIPWKKGIISFKSIAPDDSSFEVEEFKRAFLNRFSLEGSKLLNYGYAQGYKPLIDYLLGYMQSKGVDTTGKTLLITNGFTEGLDLVLSAFTNKGDSIICENPTHNTAIKLMKLHGLNIIGVTMNPDGMDIEELEDKLKTNDIKLGYVIPSYHNPTGIVIKPEKRYEIYNTFKKYRVPIIEDGFNEELLYTGSHINPIVSLAGKGNGVIYIGSFSKILFPGLRIGWILGDNRMIDILESSKRSRNIHTSFLDQAVFYEFLKSGTFEKYIKKVRNLYKKKYEFTLELAEKHIPNKYIWGEGGLHIFIELGEISSRELLNICHEKGVIFTPGDIFYTDGSGGSCFRLGFSRVSFEDIEKGIKIIGQVIKDIKKG